MFSESDSDDIDYKEYSKMAISWRRKYGKPKVEEEVKLNPQAQKSFVENRFKINNDSDSEDSNKESRMTFSLYRIKGYENQTKKEER